MGYFFINFVEPKYIIDFCKIFNSNFTFKSCKKPCTIIYAENQKIDISSEDPSRRPIIFFDTIKDGNNEKKEIEK